MLLTAHSKLDLNRHNNKQLSLDSLKYTVILKVELLCCLSQKMELMLNYLLLFLSLYIYEYLLTTTVRLK